MKLSFTKSHLSSRIDPYRIHELIKTSLISKMREREREREREITRNMFACICDGIAMGVRSRSGGTPEIHGIKLSNLSRDVPRNVRAPYI
jgi:hypothetical protein